MESKDIGDAPPAWTMFFEGPLYRKYLQYMKNHDLSKMLNNGNVLTNKNSPVQDPPILNNETCWYPNDGKALDKDSVLPDYNDPPMVYPMVNGSPPPYNFPRLNSTASGKHLTDPKQRKRRSRQTCGFVFLGILLLGLAATATALIIHFVFIKDREHVSHGGNVHIPPINGSNPNSTLGLINQGQNITVVEGGKVIGGVQTIEEAEKLITEMEREKRKKAQSSFGNTEEEEKKKKPELVLLPTDTNSTESAISLEVTLPGVTESGSLDLGNNTDASGSTDKVLTNVNDNDTSTLSTTPMDFWTTTTPTTPMPTTTPTPKPEVKILFNDTQFNIGEPGEIRCKISSVRIYDLVFIKGSSIPVGQDTILKFEVMSDGSSCLKGNDTRITADFTKTKSSQFPKYEDIELVIYISNVQCNDADSFECGTEGPEVDTATANMEVERAPDRNIRMTYPPQLIENEAVFLTARWMSGYPEEGGELIWLKTTHDSKDPVKLDIQVIESREVNFDCKTEVTSFINLSPTMEMNGTQILIKPILPDKSELETIFYDILVVPANFCAGKQPDTKHSHPYTCTKYIKCIQNESVRVMKCPGTNTCFDAEAAQCVSV